MFHKLFSILMIALLIVMASVASAQADTTVQLPEASIGVDTTSTVEVTMVCPASNCIGIDVTIAYDASVITVGEVTPGEFLGDAPRIIVSGADNPGTLRFAALSSNSARSDEGVVFEIEVTGLALGESELTVTSLSVFRRGGTLQATPQDGRIEVVEDAGSGEATPSGEPATLQVSRRLTLRGGPGADFSASGTVDANTELEVVGITEDGAWYLVTLPTGGQGWLASSRFITLTGDITAIPVADEATELATAEATEAPTEEPTETPTEAPVETEAATPDVTEEPTVEPTETEAAAETATTEVSPTAEPTKTDLPTEAPTEDVTEPSVEPTETTVPPSPTATRTTQPPTATLRSDTEANIAPPATETSEATNTLAASPTATSVPTDTATPSPTSTPEPPTPTFTATIPEPCTIIATVGNIPVSVGPNRVVRTTLPVNQPLRVTGQQEADDGSLWWRIEPLNGSVEVDRFWVRQSDVTAQGGCDVVEGAESPQVISSGGGGGGQFTGTFSGGQAFASHNFTVTASGSYLMVCSGSPTYPEFNVGNSQSRGQTTLSLNLTPGRYTLTVQSTTVNNGRNVNISSYSCQLTRR